MYKILKNLIEMDDYSIQRLSSRVSQYLWYKLWGNTVQNGTPTPDSPIMPQGTGDRTGNLFNPNSTRYHMGKGSNNRIGNVPNGAMFYIKVASNTNYTIKVHTTDSTFVRLYLSDAPIVEGVAESYNVISESETTINPEVTISNTDYTYLWIQTGGTWYTEHGGSSIMLNTGSTALPYEPYGYKIPIVCDNEIKNIYLNEPLHKINDYADILSYSEQGVVRKIKKLVLTGEENFSYDATYTRFALSIPNARFTANRSDETPCTHYVSIHDGRSIDNVPDDSIYVTAGGGYVYINIKDTTYTSLADFKTYLQQQYANGTPVTIWYVLATEETEQIKAPDILADTYTSITVDTEVQPSQTDFSTKGKKVEPTNVSSSVNTLNTMNINNEQITNDNLITNEENEEFEEI